MDAKIMDLNGGGVLDFYQRFQQLQLQRDSSDELIKVRTLSALLCSSTFPILAPRRGAKCTVDGFFSRRIF